MIEHNAYMDSIDLQAHETRHGDTLYVPTDDYTQGEMDDYAAPDEGAEVAYIERTENEDEPDEFAVFVGIYHGDEDYEATEMVRDGVYHRPLAVTYAEEALTEG